jgi:hypothetical protein
VPLGEEEAEIALLRERIYQGNVEPHCEKITARNRFSTTAGPCVGVGCVCASDIHEPVADDADATRTNARRPQPKAAAPTPDARASGALPAR